MENGKIFNSARENEEYIKKIIGGSSDIEYRKLIIPAFKFSDALIVYINKMVDSKEIDEYILKPLMSRADFPGSGSLPKISLLAKSGVFIKQAEETSEWEKACDAVINGNTVLFVDKCDTALILSTREVNTRAVSEPETESEVRGPRDGFVENIQINCSLIRNRIKDFSLRFENMKLGERTKTDISLIYIENLVSDSILKELKARLSRIKTDSILASSYLEEFIEDAPNSVFPQIEHTERPDRVCSAVLEGRIAILVDNTPFALIVPTVFWNFIQTSGDFYDRRYFGTFFRCIRIIALFLSFTLSSLYVLLASYHQEMLPTNLALKIAAGRESVPFPAVLEAFIMDVILEITKEASLRMPKSVRQTVSIVGTFIIGQAAVAAGIVAPVLVIFITTSALCSYAIPSFSMGNSVRLIRFGFLIITGCFGILGFYAALIVVILHILSLRSFGAPFFSPVIPFDKNGNKDVIIRAPLWKMSKRPNTGLPKDQSRQTSENLKPKPPETS